MLFELHNAHTNRTSHCGVLEFIAEEGMIYMPYWVHISYFAINKSLLMPVSVRNWKNTLLFHCFQMMQNMLLSEGDIVRVKSATLPKGTYVKLQPHTKDFLDISNPKAVLSISLCFSALHHLARLWITNI
jgi:ubiquitin fusion degradation protein 1